MKQRSFMKKIFLFVLTAMSAVIIIAGCTTIKQTEYRQPETIGGTKTVALLYHSTAFRNDVAKVLVEKLKEKSITVFTDDAFNVKKYDPDKYDLVIVFTGIHAFIPDGYPGYYFQKYKTKKNILRVFYTFFKGRGISVETDMINMPDTISAASLPKNRDELIDKIFELALKKLGI